MNHCMNVFPIQPLELLLNLHISHIHQFRSQLLSTVHYIIFNGFATLYPQALGSGVTLEVPAAKIPHMSLCIRMCMGSLYYHIFENISFKLRNNFLFGEQ